MSTQRTITLVEDAEGWTAIDEETGLECRGEERSQALARLDDAAAVSFDPADGEDGETADGSGDDDSELDWFEE